MSRARTITRLVAALASAGLIAALAAAPATANLGGCSECIEASDIATGAVRAAELSNDLNDTIDANDIATGAIRTAEIRNDTITTADLRFNPATQSELDAVMTATPLAQGRIAANASGALTGWATPQAVTWNDTDDRYVLDYSYIEGEGFLDDMAAVVTASSTTVDQAYWSTNDAAGELYITFEDATDTKVQTDFGVVVVLSA